MSQFEPHPEGVAIVGLAGRFPGARNAAEFWRNLAEGRDCVTRLSDEQLRATGYDPERARALPGYVAARGLVEKPEWFDRAFFNIGPKEAEVIDPQQRIFLEVAWEALEDAGCVPTRFPGLIGIFAGMSNNTYFPYFVRARRDLMEAVGVVNAVIANEKDFLTTRAAYKLNLRGPALNIQTACSSSLVSVCVACESLLAHGCDVALAGGASLTFPQERGYFYNEGGMTSADGYCRPFDARASGTIFSSGVGVVALKRIADAMADGDPIYAVIKGHAINNDGLQKVSFAAPSVDGQSDVIAQAQALAGVSPETISYIEAHGTATALGDPIEVAGLTHVFRAGTDKRQFCALGSVKGNIGHCDAASGVTGLIKVALAMRYGQIPPSINCEQINPALEIEESPFFINTELRPWKGVADGLAPRRAGISSFGVGGTNAHAVLEEAPVPTPAGEGRSASVLVLSAKSTSAMERRALDLADHLEKEPAKYAGGLDDLAWTLQTGRQVFAHRRAVIARDSAAAIAALRAPGKLVRSEERLDARAALLFPGQGSQYPGMGLGLHSSEPVFREAFDECSAILRPELGCDLHELLFTTAPDAATRLRETRFTQPVIFAMDYALGRLWMSMGIEPAALIGHSIGEWAAATLAGVFSLPDAARLVSLRARLVQALTGGAMLASRLSEADAREWIAEDSRLEIAAVNGPSLCVISGPFEAVEALEARFTSGHVAARRLSTSHAFHSAMMEPVVDALAKAVGLVQLRAPGLPIISSVTGQRLSDHEATDPGYWAAHLRVTVRFADALASLCSIHDGALIEAGPGRALTQLAFQCPAKTSRHEIVNTIAEGADEAASVAEAIARLWLGGVPLDWKAVHGGETRRRVSGLPAYPFERQRYFADLPPGVPMPLATAATDGEAPWDTAQEVVRTPAIPADVPKAVAEPAAAESGGADDATDMLAMLRRQLSEVSGLDLANASPSTSLLELGFDSLFLSQVALSLTRKFGVKITLGQLIRELDTLEALAAHLAAHAPASAVIPVPQPAKRVATVRKAETNPASGHGPFQPVRPGLGVNLTGGQEKWLHDFIGRYTARTAASKAHTQAHRRRLADARTVSGFVQAWKEMVYPIVVTRSSGVNLWDLDGNEWNDVTLSFGAAMLGHQPPFVVEAIQTQTELGFEIGPTSPLAGEVASLLCELTGGERAAFCNTGSEAVVGALRIARAVTGRPRIVYFSESYHGIDSEVLGRAPAVGHEAALPIAPGIPAEALANALILNYGDPAALEIIAREANDIAAVLVEPVQSRRPGAQPAGFLREIRDLTARHGIALIFDEMITGFRCNLGGAQAHFGVQADIATYGKVIGGGLPIGAIVGRAQYLDAFDGGDWSFGDDSFPQASMTFFAGTFVRHPLVLAAARAVLGYLKKAGPGLQETLTGRTEGMIRGINSALEGTPFAADSFGSNWLLRSAPDFRFTALMFAALRHRGIHIWQGRPCFVSTAHSDAAIEQVVTAFRESAAELEEAGFFTRTASPQAPAAGVIPLTPAQREVWLLSQQNATANSACNETWTLSLDGPLDADALRQAVQTIVDRHDSLRCTFDRLGETVAIAPKLTLDVPLTDLSTLDAGERDARFAILRAAEGSRSFDLADGPLVAVQLVRLAPEAHALVFAAHHLACDGWSCDIFLSELSAIYSAHCESRAPALPRPMSVREYQQWDESLRRTPEYAAEMKFWLDAHRAPHQALELPGDRPHPAQRSFRGASDELILPREMVPALTRLGAQHGATFFTVLLAAYQTLLFRLSGEADLTMGVPSAGQNNVPGGEALMGHCVNMLPLRFRLDPDKSFGKLLRDLQGAVIDAFEHRRVTFGELLQKLAPARMPGRVPLIPATFNLDPPMTPLRFPGAAYRLAPNPRQAFQFDFSISCDTAAEGLRATCRYNTDILEAATVRRWLGHFRTILEGALADAAQTIAKMPLLTDPERHTLLAEWNQTERDYPRGNALHALFEEQARKTPGAISLAFEDGQFTFDELNARANRMAHRLRGLGVRRDVPVGICLDRCAELPVALLAVLKAGGAYVPLDPSYPEERVAFMIADARMPVIISHSRWQERLGKKAKVLCVDLENLESESAENPAVEIRPEDLAYIIYTSGSTGRPKGAMIPHRAICNHMHWMQDEFPIGPGDRVLQKTPISFDASVWEFWAPLLAGATLVLASPEAHRDSRLLVEAVANHGITILQLVPSMLRIFAAEPGLAKCATLRRLFCGGEPLTPDICEAVFARLGCELINLYGPTECAIDTVFHRCSRSGGRVPIGRPVANTRLYILDARQEPAPIGIPGELYIAGEQLARGYYSNPELTAEKFVMLNGERVYKTGDLARWLPNGEVECLGRGDDQVKIRGHRIELGEIESQIRQQTAVRDCAVAVHEGQLAAYIVQNTADDSISLWPSSPSSGGNPFYDDVLYNAMTQNHSRLNSYRRAFERHVPGKAVVDIGTGRDALLARMCIEAGARKVYAIELLERPYQQAKALVRSLGLEDRITLIRGRSQDIELPERVDVCVSENIGHIGDTEGWSGIIADAARRLVKPGGVFIPRACVTKFAAVSLPKEFLDDPRFDEMGANYARETWNGAGYRHDFRVCLTNTSHALLRSTEDIFEAIDAASLPGASFERQASLVMTADSQVDGFLLWLDLEFAEGEKLETLDRKDAWLPVYLPVFYPGTHLREGDRIEATIRGSLAGNQINRDYRIAGRVFRGETEVMPFSFDSWHYKQVYKASPFYGRIFRDDAIPTALPAITKEALNSALSKSLPDYMVPTAIVSLPALPRTPSGKLDRRALPPPAQMSAGNSRPVLAEPRTALERELAGIWRNVLNLEQIGVHDNFFEIGGESLLGLRVLNRLRDLLGENISLAIIFDAPTIERLAQHLERNYTDAVGRWLGGNRREESQESAKPAGKAEVAASRAPITRLSRDQRRVSRAALREISNGVRADD